MRIPIALQLALLVLVTSLVGLAVISIATWENNYKFVTGVKSQGLILAASLKAGQVASNIALIEATCQTVTTRILIQSALRRFYQGNTTDANWVTAITDVQSALGSGGYVSLFQAKIFSRNPAGDQGGILNVTSNVLTEEIVLPYKYDNGSSVILGDSGLGYPPSLYPNLTYSVASGVDPADATSEQATAYAFPDFPIQRTSALLLGPLYVNNSFSLISLTLPIINNTSYTDILGYMTIVASAASVQSALVDNNGLDSTASVLLVGPATADNLFNGDAVTATRTTPDVNKTALQNAEARYIFTPDLVDGSEDRHNKYRSTEEPFKLSQYPAVLDALETPRSTYANSSSNLDTHNEQGYRVAVGVARPQSTLVDWVLVIEETHAQAFGPVSHLRKIIIACVFGTAGFIAVAVIPLAHYSVTPIRKLKAATEKSIHPSHYHHLGDDPHGPNGGAVLETLNAQSEKQGGIFGVFKRIKHGRWGRSQGTASEDGRSKTFKVPGKVKESKHIVTDELTELTSTFNEMADELMIQYTRLEERVAERTRELEISKKAAETANESKTLFIANISHELKTPLNGILGMCAVCMGEDDLPRIKKSLKVVYKSGDLLLHLLNDLLTFSKNEIDSAIRLDEKEFNLADIKSQILTIFEKQVLEKNVHFTVKFIGAPAAAETIIMDNDEKHALGTTSHAYGPPGTARMKDMILWGDQHRILQVLINLVSNSLKFTPEGGRVEVRIKCLGDYEKPEGSTKISFDSRSNSAMRSRTPSFQSRDTYMGGSVAGSAFDHYSREREQPVNYRTLAFSFEVEDTGPGIPAHLQQRVFEPFMQGDLGLNRKYGGTGLGLSICSQLARLMGGTIHLDSTVGKGSTFRVDVPLKYLKEMAPSTRSSSTAESSPPSEIVSLDDAANINRTSDANSPVVKPVEAQDLQPRLVGLSQPFFAAAPPSQSTINNSTSTTTVTSTSDSKRHVPAPASSTSFKSSLSASDSTTTTKIRVLVAEDNAVNQEVVLRMLKLEDIYDVTVAKDGQEAYDTVKAAMSEGNKFDLIFMDIQMPNLDGLESTRLIRQMGYSAPIVALSAFAEESNIKDCMESGMDMFLSKPIRRPALKQVLKKFATIVEEDGETS
ncbi:sensor histidine kinase/response regulator TcsB/Sln1, putative [Talaromyces stipitatus ATCC 10500]|uniref:histidine kinase n=1 Tax=Talaromyces stipitatus (strain ATCC 10500 / CBS 375.48 / QM 6759 / NRRL 1006) TaxID=441959 RepID=B8M4M1_TALSN|nr:sensor histidine kinase/response regulator TcsB/Sln1, putative [Talaromyces stipitatus ATCC 10500]EED19216.1 sensor histidine kinase/response regulator TcsB/Sln1, putative [Talaromyces stipitatus ATCC 10500]